jgi:hypothetical protein
MFLFPISDQYLFTHIRQTGKQHVYQTQFTICLPQKRGLNFYGDFVWVWKHRFNRNTSCTDLSD